jgi:hypothetical protein
VLAHKRNPRGPPPCGLPARSPNGGFADLLEPHAGPILVAQRNGVVGGDHRTPRCERCQAFSALRLRRQIRVASGRTLVGAFTFWPVRNPKICWQRYGSPLGWAGWPPGRSGRPRSAGSPWRNDPREMSAIDVRFLEQPFGSRIRRLDGKTRPTFQWQCHGCTWLTRGQMTRSWATYNESPVCRFSIFVADSHLD